MTKKNQPKKKNTIYYPFPQQRNALYLHDFANLNYTYSFEIP